MFCANCGSKLKENALFCTVCGKKIPVSKPVMPPQRPMEEEVMKAEVVVLPVVVEEAPISVPEVVESAPVEEIVEPVAEEVEPVVEEVEPVVEEAEPVVEEVEPVVEEAEPVVEEAEPVVEEVEPIAEEAEPVVEEVEPVVEEAEPVVEEAEPVVEEPAPLFSAAPVVEQPQPSLARPEPVPVAPQPAPVQPEPAPAPKRVKEYKPRRKPHIVLRILLQLLSLVLCLTLTAGLVGTVVLADLNHLMSAGGIKQIINAILMPSSDSRTPTPNTGAIGYLADAGISLPGNVDLSDLPEDLLTGGSTEETIDKLIDWAYEKIEESSKTPLQFTKEDVEEFVEESTVSDFVAEKLAAYTEDFINGTENVTITVDEIMDLLEENEELIEEKFSVEMTSEVRQSIEKNVVKVVEQNNLNTVIREQVFESVEQTIDKSVEDMGMSWEEIQPIVQLLCADATLYIAIGICVLLMVLLCLLNYYNVPAGLTWIAVPSMLVGLVLTLPLVLLQASPQLFTQFLPDMVVAVIAPFADVLIPIHAVVLVVGLALLVISIFWRVIRSVVNRKRSRAAVA